MKKIALLPLIFIFLLTALFAGETKQLTLKNGMIVILKENHSTPMVSSIVCVRAGSKYENESNNGFTHFLEHLLFNGTKNLTRLELNEGFEDHGGYINAFTQKDLTGYLFVIPSIYAEYALQTQADQLFNSILPESEFPKERKIVAEEINMYNDEPDYQADMFFDSLIYQNTPFARTVLGPKDIIASIPREEVLTYYQQRYLPNNMIALFMGDFNLDEFAKLVDKYYGAFPSGELPKPQSFKINPPYSQSVHFKEYAAEVTRIYIVFPAPHYTEKDYYAVDMLAQILDAGESSPLNKALMSGDEPLINEMSFYLEANKDFSLLHFAASSNYPEKVDYIVASTVGFLASLENQQFDKKQLMRIVVKNKTDKIYLEERLHYYGVIQAPLLVNFGYNFMENYVSNLSRVKPADIQKAAKKYLGVRRYLAMAVVPSAMEEN
jgi:zinc protease